MSEEFGVLREATKRLSFGLWVLDGSKLESKEAILDALRELIRQTQSPGSEVRNRTSAAIRDGMRRFGEAAAWRGQALVVEHADALRRADPVLYREFLDAMRSVSRELDELRGACFKTVLLAETDATRRDIAHRVT
ncbi:MAG: hypothetical protein KGM24_03900 [Elusimicrobia bacterium]|nr:hypothetical protein [Elusimicrobiota bacterium]